MGLCPIHCEKSPSYSVSPTKQFFHCLGCGKNGNAIGFLMEHAGMTFIEAVKDLAQQVGMQVPEDVEARYKAALAWLKDVAKGAAEIVVPTPPDAPEPQPPETGVEFAPGCHDRFF